MELQFTVSDIINSIVAVAGLLTSILTILIIKESRLMRKYYSTPEISIYLKFAEAAPSHLYICIENLGMGTAHEVSFTILEDYKHYQPQVEKLISKGIFKRKMEHFYPKQFFKYLVDSLHDRTEEQLKDPIVISALYYDDFGKQHQRLFNLYIEVFLGGGMLTPGDTHIRVISYRLEQMQKDINKLTNGILEMVKNKLEKQ